MSERNLRPELAQHLAQRVQAFSEGFRHNLAIVGPLGSGKTFQLQHLLDARPAGVFLIYCPLYRESPRSFLTRFASSILTGALAGLPEPAGAAQVLGPEVSSARAQRTLPKTAEALRVVESLLARRLYSEALTRTFDAIPAVVEERGQPCVLILDEFLYLEDMGFLHAFHELGKRVMTWSTTLFILSSSAPYRSRMILRERLQLLFGQFELLTLGALNPETALPWAQHELRSVRRSKLISPFLIQWLGNYPWYLSVFTKRLRELATLRKTPEVSEALFLQTAWDLLGSPEGTLHHWCASRLEGLAHLRLGRRALEALIQIALGARTATAIGRQIGRASLAQALQLLVEQDLAQRNGTCWMVEDPVLRCWLATILVAQRAEARPGAGTTRQQFDGHLRSLWARWAQAGQRSFSEQVADLFARFADETVSVDSKTGRLPRFESIKSQPAEGGAPGAYLIAESQGRRWCATVQEGGVDEAHVARFDAFCRLQNPRPSRKLVITRTGLDQSARVLAKAVNMWVWEAPDIQHLVGLYGR